MAELNASRTALRLTTSLALALAFAASLVARQAPPDLAYEKPALAALAKEKPPTAFPFDLSPFRVPVPDRHGLVAVEKRRLPHGRRAGRDDGRQNVPSMQLDDGAAHQRVR